MYAEDLHEQVATLKLLVATQKENIEFLTGEAEHLAKKLAKVESEDDYDLTHKCAFTDNGMIDDCGIELHFGYGSNRDMESYVIKNVSDGMGEKVLKFLNDNFVNGSDIRDYLRESPLAKKEDVELPTDTTIYNAENHIQ
jgi:hypothetical protein